MDTDSNSNQKLKNPWIILGLILFVLATSLIFVKTNVFKSSKKPIIKSLDITDTITDQASPVATTLDFAAYDKKLLENANSSTTTTTITNLWPVKTVYPNAGAILPFNRIVAYYGNLYSKNMGILGEYPEAEMIRRLSTEVKKWTLVDPTTPVIPALHYIAVVAQAGPGRDGMYRARMPSTEIEKVLAMAEKNKAIVFLDIQVGLSNVQTELPFLEKYLKLPNVHLGIDPEFSMKTGALPGTVIGTLDAEDVNFAAKYLVKIVKENNLPPKILIIHRFTQPMLTHAENIKPLPEVQIVINMDGFGGQGAKLNTYKQYIYKEPVQFTGFKLFYKNDSAGVGLFTPTQLLKLSPIPIYIQYQ